MSVRRPFHLILLAAVISVWALAQGAMAQTLIYTPSEKPPEISYANAKAYFSGCGNAIVRSLIVHTKVLDDGFVWTLKDGTQHRFYHRNMGEPYVHEYGFFSDTYNIEGIKFSMKTDGQTRVLYHYSDQQEEVARRCADALYVLRRGVPPEDPLEISRFEETVRRFREVSEKPEFPEGARRFRVQAETAASERRFDDAADRYEQALKLAPWWPEGRFNRAVVLGELERYTEAIREMKKYLALVPDASNSRKAQDQIYAWEDKAGTAK